MFTYNLTTHTSEGQSALPGIQSPRNTDPRDVTEQAGDAIVMVWPYAEPDTFNFETQGTNSDNLVIKKGKNKKGEEYKTVNVADIKLTKDPIYLDTYITNLNVRQTKENHQGMMSMVLLDPDDSALSSISPGDHIVCWMFDNHKDAQNTRAKLASKAYAGLNAFNSGLKFVGKVFSVRKNINVLNSGAKMRRLQILATSFSELDSNIYFDPQLATNFFNGLQFMQAIAGQLNSVNGQPEDINKMLSNYLTVFMGIGLKTNGQLAQSQMSRPLKMPDFIGQILGLSNATHYIDILRTHIGIEKYSGDNYLPDLGKTATVPHGGKTTSPYKTIQYSPLGLVGWNNIQVAPFNNIPMWSILKQTSNPNINEMFTTLKMDNKGSIAPTLTIRQIPFNTESFVAKYGSDIPATAFRTLPRWKVSDEIITDYSVGKSESLRINFVRVSATPEINQQTGNAAARALVGPTSDIADIERNGLRAYVTTINATLDASHANVSTKQWTAVATDRLMGSHLKLSGTMKLAGTQEPITVGDNLLYNDLVFHIEQVEHSLTVDGQTGRKSFSTSLAISNGVPAAGPVLPEITERVVSRVNPLPPDMPNRVGLVNVVSTNAKKDDN